MRGSRWLVVAGVVMLHFSGDGEVVGELLAEGVALVLISAWDERADCVAVDDGRGAQLAVEHLIGLGHGRIAYVSSGVLEASTDRARLEGYERAIRGASLAAGPASVLTWDHRPHAGAV